MKHFLYLYILCFIFLLVLGWYHTKVQYQELESKFAFESAVKEARIQELEKEVRLLKTDVAIMNDGFPEK